MNHNFLKKVPLFSSMEPDILKELAGNLKSESFAGNEIIFRMEEKGEKFYMIESGKVQITYPDENGHENTLTLLGPGAFFGELALIDGGTHTASARTVGDTVLLTLDKEAFHLYMDQHPQLANALLHALTARLRSSTIKLRGVTNINDQLQAKNSAFQDFIDHLAKGLTSSGFLGICIIFILLWIAIQVYYFLSAGAGIISFVDNPPTFFVLGFILTLTNFLLTILILSSQRRQAENDRIRGDVEYQVNLKSQKEIMKLQLKMDQLIHHVEPSSGFTNAADDDHDSF